MSTPAAPPRPHRRAAAQLLLGYLPLLTVGVVLLAVVTAAEQRGWDVEDALREAVRRYAGELDAEADATP